VKLKGAQTLIEAFRRYAAADLVVAGDGPYGDELRSQAAGLDHVRFTGRVHPRELRKLYAGAIAVVIPSLVYETFGLIALEAFAQGTPVIARDLGAPPEVVAESGGGFTYRSDADLVEAMERLRTDPALREELGGRGRDTLRARWSEAAHLEGYSAAIDEARGGRG
jgi:glycosyltransferase involved in cell wall biosynthesis